MLNVTWTLKCQAFEKSRKQLRNVSLKKIVKTFEIPHLVARPNVRPLINEDSSNFNRSSSVVCRFEVMIPH